MSEFSSISVNRWHLMTIAFIVFSFPVNAYITSLIRHESMMRFSSCTVFSFSMASLSPFSMMFINFPVLSSLRDLVFPLLSSLSSFSPTFVLMPLSSVGL